MKKNRLGHRYIELKNCIVYFRTRKHKHLFFLKPTICVSPVSVEFSFLKYAFCVLVEDKSFKEYI